MLPTFKKKKRERQRDRDTEAHRRGYSGAQERIQRRTGENTRKERS